MEGLKSQCENSSKPKSLPSQLKYEVDNDTERNQLCGLGVRPGMECMPLRSPTGPYNHYHHVADQTKSLQELQNEVGALLEFRDLVIETFPDLKTKMSSSTANSTITGIPSSSSLASRREWEPGIRVRRKLTQKENSEISSSSLIRSRSNSHSGKKEPKSGEGNGSVIQDSGFSTETSSSKETHSASSTTGAGQASTVTTSTTATSRLHLDSDDELWNLLDVIHRKSNRLRDEVEHLQNLERERCQSDGGGGGNGPTSPLPTTTATSFKKQLERVNKDDVQILRKERDRLLDKLSEMEAETISERIRASKKQDEIDGLFSAKRDLEEQLRTALSQKMELNSRIHDLHLQFVNKSAPGSPETGKSPPRLPVVPAARKSSSTDINASSAMGPTPTQLLLHINGKNRTNSSFQPVVATSPTTNNNKTVIDLAGRAAFLDQKQVKNDLNLGRLDGLVSAPNRTCKVSAADSKKIAAILLETNIVELQRHLLTITVQNQLLLQRLESATRSKIFLMKKLDKSREEIDDLKFQLEERNIELEGTRAQLRIIESKSSSRSEYSTPEHHRSSTTILLNQPSSRDSSTLRLSQTQISTPSMKAMVPLAMDEVLQHSSSTESAQDQTERECSSTRTTITYPDTPKRRPPSKIPLPGSKPVSTVTTTPSPTAPKPPSGRNYVATHHRSTSGPPSNRSLTKSQGSLPSKTSGPPSVNLTSKKEIPSLTRADHSWRNKDTSLERSRSSSIPIASTAKTSPLAKTLTPASTQHQHHHTNTVFVTSTQQISASPLPKPKRDTLTNKVKHLDSLSRLQQQTLAASTTQLNNNNNYKFNNTKRDLNLSTNNLLSTNAGVVIRSGGGGGVGATIGQVGLTADYKNKSTVPIRRGSSASMGRNSTGGGGGGDSHQQLQQDVDNGKTNKVLPHASPFFLVTSSGRKTAPTRELRPLDDRSSKLIDKYLAKACPPPAMFTPSFSACEANPQIDLAYQHPIFLMGNGGGYTATSSGVSVSTHGESIEKNKEVEIVEIKYIDDEESFGRATKDEVNNRKNLETTHLVGRINPNIIKTWEQLSGNTLKAKTSTTTTTTQAGRPETNCILFHRKTYDSNERNFGPTPSTVQAENYFFDSIDAPSLLSSVDIDEYDVTCNEKYIMSCRNYDQAMMDSNMMTMTSAAMPSAGEGLAELDSLDRVHMQWSMEK